MEMGFRSFSFAEGDVSDLDGDRLDDFRIALNARDNAYAPYSHFKVGAALRMGNDRVFSGWNSETIAYDGVHAEEAARSSVDAESRLSGLKRVVIVGAPEGEENFCEPTAPCGACRQKLLELSYGVPDVEVVMASIRGRVIVVTLNDLLPFAFFPRDLLQK